jgi:hypothetical protein
MNKSVKKLILLLIVLAIIVSSLVFVNTVNEKEKASLFQLRKNIKSYGILPSDSEIERKISNLENKISSIEPHLFDRNEPVVFIEMIEDLAIKNNVSSSVESAESIGSEEGKDVGGQISLTVSAGGSLQNLRNLVFDLENTDKEVEVKTLRLTRAETEEGFSWRLMFNVTGKTK